MNLQKFLQEKIPYLLGSFSFLLLCGILIWAFLPEKWVTVLILFISFWIILQLPFLIFEYVKKRRFYNEMFARLSQLNNKNYISEMSSAADFLDARMLTEIIRICSKSYLDNLAEYKSARENYREYIELWIHEIKTPLAWGMLSLENAQTELRPDSFDILSGAYEEIEHKVQQVLYYSRSNSVEKDFQLGAINLSELCRAAVKERSRLLISHQAALSFLNVDRTVYSDSKWLLFILGQLLDNSVKYRSDAPLLVTFDSYQTSHHTILRITDNGIGIPPAERPHVFEKGFTGSHGHRAEKSTGMGLYICQKLSRKLGIELCAADPGSTEHGAVFEICFPYDKDLQIDLFPSINV